MKIRKLTNEEIKGACAFAVSIYNIAIRGCFRTQDCHRYFDEYMDADRLTDEERAGVLVVFLLYSFWDRYCRERKNNVSFRCIFVSRLDIP